MFLVFTDGKQHKACKFDMITLRNHTPRSHDLNTCGLDYSQHDFLSYLQIGDITGADFKNLMYAFGQSQKR